jgi:type II secretion system protein G
MKRLAPTCFQTRSRRAFTLIELLIVVAIIAILAAIAVPNFIEAQTRSKVSRVKADFRTIATALEAYCVDNNDYPYWAEVGIKQYLTTPIPYLTSNCTEDVFNKGLRAKDANGNYNSIFQDYNYVSYHGDWGTGAWVNSIYGHGIDYRGYALVGVGPDHWGQQSEVIGLPDDGYPQAWGPKIKYYYDPTNGTVSMGDILRFGGTNYAPIKN